MCKKACKSTVPEWVVTTVALSLGTLCVILTCIALRQTIRSWKLQSRLLLKALPAAVVKRMKSGERVVDSFEGATIVFADIVGYTAFSSMVSPEELVTVLDSVFNRLDIECARFGCLKVKPIGDCYMAAAGLPERQASADLLLRGVLLAWLLAKAMELYAHETGEPLQLRGGCHHGRVTAGVIGQERLQVILSLNYVKQTSCHLQISKHWACLFLSST